MKTCLSALACGLLVLGAGCKQKEDPRSRPGFVDTSDPAKVSGTMKPLPKNSADPTSLGGKKPGP